MSIEEAVEEIITQENNKHLYLLEHIYYKET